MNEPEQFPTAWPERWSSAHDAPPLARDFVASLERPPIAPAALREPPMRRLPWRSAALGLSAAVVLGLAASWALMPTAPEAPMLVAVSDPVVASPLPAEPAAPLPEPAPEPAAPRMGAPVPVGPAPVAPGPAEPATEVSAEDEGTLQLETTPSAEVSIDGRLVGTTPLRLTLAAGEHTLRLSRPELRIDASETVVIPAGGTLRLVRTLEGLPEGPEALTSTARYESARACAIAGDHACVVRELRGHCAEARHYELYIASLRSTAGTAREIESSMREYLSRFPTGRQAAQYRLYLVRHSSAAVRRRRP